MENDHERILRLCRSDQNEAIAQKKRCKKVREQCAEMLTRLEQQRDDLRALNERLRKWFEKGKHD